MATTDDKVTASLEQQLDPRYKIHRLIKWISHSVVLVLSMALIVWISYDTFEKIPFLQNRSYMTFQLLVCLVFMADFFVGLSMSRFRLTYLRYHWFYFLISIPYLNIIDIFDIDFTQNTLYFIRFIPLIRGAYSLAMVIGYFSSNRALSILASYAAILLSLVYFASLIFYRQESPVNSDVPDYWAALWWACMNVTTIGCYINPMTIAGKVCGVILAAMGMMMLPLFTVYITTRVQQYNKRKQKQDMLLRMAFEKQTAAEGKKNNASTVAGVNKNS